LEFGWLIDTQNHEIRTPLVGVLGMTDLLLMQTSLAPAVAEQLQVIHESGNALLHIINNILDVSKLSAGMVRLESRVCPSTLRNNCVHLQWQLTEAVLFALTDLIGL